MADTPSVEYVNTMCACAVPAWDIATESLCFDKGQYVVWVQCKRCRKASWFALLMLADGDA